MRKFLLLLLLIPSLSWGNTYSEILDSKKIGYLECKNELTTNLSTNEKESRVYCVFQNIEYSAIIDTGVVVWVNSEDITNSISQLTNCLSFMDKKGYEMECGRSFYLYNFTKDISVFSRGMSGREKSTYINKKETIELIEWLKNIEFFSL